MILNNFFSPVIKFPTSQSLSSSITFIIAGTASFASICPSTSAIRLTWPDCADHTVAYMVWLSSGFDFAPDCREFAHRLNSKQSFFDSNPVLGQLCTRGSSANKVISPGLIDDGYVTSVSLLWRTMGSARPLHPDHCRLLPRRISLPLPTALQ